MHGQHFSIGRVRKDKQLSQFVSTFSSTC
jgi:hypothetical protein